eukprot:jgi/Chlat1/315/Chrsp1S03068
MCTLRMHCETKQQLLDNLQRIADHVQHGTFAEAADNTAQHAATERLWSAATEGRWGDMCTAIEDEHANVNQAGVWHHIVKHCAETGVGDELINKVLEAALSGDWHSVRRCLLRDVGWDVNGVPFGASKLVDHNIIPSMTAALPAHRSYPTSTLLCALACTSSRPLCMWQ